MYKSITINGGSIGRVISNNQVIWSKSKANPINKLVLPDGRYSAHRTTLKIGCIVNQTIENYQSITQIEYDGKVINATFELVDQYNGEYTYLFSTTDKDREDFLYNFIKLDPTKWWDQKTNPRPVYAIR